MVPLAFASHDEVFEVVLGGVLAESVFYWVVVPLENIKLRVVFVGLTVSKGNKEEIWLKLFDSCSFSEYSWHGLFSLGLSDYHFLRVSAVSKDVVSFKSLALVRSHVAFNSNGLILLLLNHNCHVF